jgi:DNA repair protein RecN (Recombination protein N)
LAILADQLSHKRRGVTAHFETSVHDLLHQLAMEYARIKVEVRQLTELNMTGCDEVEFMFAPNKGSKFASIKDTASGGELSRLTLCTKSLVASAIPLPTLIFDEIDTGISGDVALKMGNILRDLSTHHQVISITHSAQIASKADKHYFVYKRALEDRTITSVKSLNMDERVRAIATMLSTSPPSASAIENAKELIAAAAV